MDQFVYAVDIPSTRTQAYFKEFNIAYYKAFVKTLLNNDPYATCRFIDGIITNLTHTGPSVDTLTSVDKLSIMLSIRAYNISSTVQFTSKTAQGKDIAVKININDILQIINSFELQHKFSVTNTHGISIDCGLPTWLYYEDLSGLVASCVDAVTINDKRVLLNHLSYSEQTNIINQLPSEVFTKIVTFIKPQNDIISENPIFKMDESIELEGSSTISLSLYDNSLYEFISMMFNANLKEFYETEYQLCKLKMQYEMISAYTPAELSLLFSVINDDIKKQQQEMDKQNNDTNMPAPPGGAG